jgi:hypothetical protein
VRGRRNLNGAGERERACELCVVQQSVCCARSEPWKYMKRPPPQWRVVKRAREFRSQQEKNGVERRSSAV